MLLDFVIPRSFSPTHSPLGRLILRRTGDRLRAGAVYINAVTFGVVGWLLIDFAVWGLLADTIRSDPAGSAAVAFFAFQLGIPVAGLLLAGIGFRPEIRVLLNDDGLTIARGAERLHLTRGEVRSAETMDAVAYHRGPRLLRSTRPFINRPVESVLVIARDDGLVVLGLDPADRKRLLTALRPTVSRAPRTIRSPERSALRAS
ncbi:MAG: hypothetical protein HKN17_04025 [Rhodothermales bacterium]|nr:hypothetical protein [Rhodothermales bacterium]